MERRNVPETAIGGEIPDTPVQMEPKLRRQRFVRQRNAVLEAPLLQEGKVDVCILSSECLPGHFHSAVSRVFGGGRCRWLC